MRSRHLTGLLLVLLATLAALPAMASATPGYYAEAYDADWTGSMAIGNLEIKTEAGKIECDTHFEGTMFEEEPTLNVIPSYSGCKAFGFGTATLTASECDFILTATEKIFGGEYRNTFDIACFKPMVVVAATCEAEFKTQTGLSNVISYSSGEGELIFDLNVSGIAYTVTKDGFLCPFNGTGNKTGGTYTGIAVGSSPGTIIGIHGS